MGIEENGEDSTLPLWINFEFLTEVISQHLNKDISVTDFSLKRALPKGENYLSILYRVAVEYKEKEANGTEKYYLIIKSLPEGELMQKILSEMKGFQKESYMYTNVLPTMYRILKSAKIPIKPFSARCFPCTRENVIVMEDLKFLDYKMQMRLKGLDLEHCTLAVRALARFHAVSIALYKSDPSIKEIYDEGLYKDRKDEEKSEQAKNFTENSINSLASVVETWQGYEKYGEKLRKLVPNCRERMIEIVKPKKDALNVLNHGDFWVNNMLFRYCPETGKVEDVKFVDFQIGRFSSPALDLQYFMCNCPNDEVRFKHRDTLLEEYYSEFADYCKALHLESELISLEELKEEFEEKNYFGLITACSVLCLILAQGDEVPETKELKEEDRQSGENILTKNAVSGKRYREIFQRLLVYYEEKGVL